MTGSAEDQIVKSRDDQVPVLLEISSGDELQPFRLKQGATCAWMKPDEAIGYDKLRARLEPWLTALFQSEHLSLLVASGLSHAIHSMATGSALPGMTKREVGAFDSQIAAEAKRSASAAGRQAGNIEDHIRAASELLRGLEIAAVGKAAGSEEQKQIEALKKGLKALLGDFAASVLEGEASLEQQWRQVGNAVPPLLAEILGDTIAEHLAKQVLLRRAA